MRLLLGVDIGTSSLKLGVIDVDSGDFRGWSESTYQLLHPSVGLAELPAETYFDAFTRALSSLSQKVDIKQIKALSVSSQAQTFVPIDQSGVPLQNAWSWIDSRAQKQAHKLSEHFGADKIFQHTGLDAVTSGSLAAMIKYICEEKPEIFSRTWKFLQIAGYLIYRLTGKAVWDENIAAMSCLYDWPNRCWWSEMLDAVGITSDMLADVLPSASPVATITAEVGLSKDTLVVTGANDQTANALGAGLIDETKTLIVLGTALIGFRVNSAGALPQTRDYHGICSVYPVEKMSYQLGYTNSGCATFDWAKSLLADGLTYEDVFQRIKNVPPGSDGVISLIDLDGRAWPENINYRGSFAGLSRKTDRWTFLRAIVEGICFSTRELIETLHWDLTGQSARVVGGAIRSDLWMQILAGVLNIPLERLANDQSGVTGSAIMAGVGSGIFDDYSEAISRVVKPADTICPDNNISKVYADVYQRFKKLRMSMDKFYTA